MAEEKGDKNSKSEGVFFERITSLMTPKAEKIHENKAEKVDGSTTFHPVLSEGQPKAEAVDTKQSPGVNWLADLTMLPSSMRQARIMEFCYPPLAKSLNAGEITQTANKFLECLSKQRENQDQDRPIIFVAHAYGGLVLEKALVIDGASPAGTDEKKPSQYLRLRCEGRQNPNTAATSTPNVTLLHPDPRNGSTGNTKAAESTSSGIPPPKTLYGLSVVAGAIFIETDMADPKGDEEFQYNFLCLTVKWDIPVRWYSNTQQRRAIDPNKWKPSTNARLFKICAEQVTIYFQCIEASG